MSEVTIVFADLTGSTGIFESLGNSKAAEVVSRTTQWMGQICEARGGRVIKYLGDGVLMSFDDNAACVQAAIDIQRLHPKRIASWPDNLKMQIKMGLARGDVVLQDGDCFGDAVNVASRLSDLSGADQIFATKAVIEALAPGIQVQSRHLGPMNLRGKSEQLPVYRIEWQEDELPELLTVQPDIEAYGNGGQPPSVHLELSCQNVSMTFYPDDLPIFLGRGNDAQFLVKDPRVSRLHTKIKLYGDAFFLEDISSFGTWVRFSGSDSVLALRRQECALLAQGTLALGCSFDDTSAPIVNYRIFNSPMHTAPVKMDTPGEN